MCIFCIASYATYTYTNTNTYTNTITYSYNQVRIFPENRCPLAKKDTTQTVVSCIGYIIPCRWPAGGLQ